MNPAKAEKSEQTTIGCFEKLAADVSDAELAKMKEYMLKKYQENKVENSYWVQILKDAVVEGIDMYSDYERVINSLTTDEMEKFVSGIVKNGSRFELLMLPE